MVLNIFPRKKEVAPAASPEPEIRLPEPSAEAMAEIDGQDGDAAQSARRTRRGTRGGRGRRRTDGEIIADATDELEPLANLQPEPEPGPEPATEEKPKAPRRTRAKKVEKDVEGETLQAAELAPVTDAAEPPARPVRRARTAKPAPATDEVSSETKAVAEPVAATPPHQPDVQEHAGRKAETQEHATRHADVHEHAPRHHGEPRHLREPREPRTTTETGDNAQVKAILRAIEQQQHQIDQLTRLHEDIARRAGSGGGSSASPSAPPARVGIFVDAANIELASDRLRARFDWKKILDMVTKDRVLVRAIAYSPVHDDPGVSIETQRFVEPFLDKGYKVVTKPLKRFADGTIKANVDIEIALDVIEMLDRLDIVVLASGDGDFQRLVEVVQAKGVRVEVVSVGASTASNLRHAADKFIDLQSRLREVRV